MGFYHISVSPLPSSFPRAGKTFHFSSDTRRGVGGVRLQHRSWGGRRGWWLLTPQSTTAKRVRVKKKRHFLADCLLVFGPSSRFCRVLLSGGGWVGPEPFPEDTLGCLFVYICLYIHIHCTKETLWYTIFDKKGKKISKTASFISFLLFLL